jgi:hypothetical protein
VADCRGVAVVREGVKRIGKIRIIMCHKDSRCFFGGWSKGACGKLNVYKLASFRDSRQMNPVIVRMIGAGTIEKRFVSPGCENVMEMSGNHGSHPRVEE